MSKELSGLVMDMKSTDILVIIIYLKLPSAGLFRGYPVADSFYNASLPANRAEAELTLRCACSPIFWQVTLRFYVNKLDVHFKFKPI